jgi:hypothetical protein
MAKEDDEEVVVVDGPSPSSPSSSSSLSSSSSPPLAWGPMCELFAMTLGMEPSDVAKQVNADLLVSDSCGGSVEAAIDLFLSDEALAKQLAPPSDPVSSASYSSSSSSSSSSLSLFSSSSSSSSAPPPPPPPLPAPVAMSFHSVVLSCGHVDAALDAASTFAAVSHLCEGIKSKEVGCSAVVEDGVGEFSDGRFTVVAPLDVRWC